MHIYTFVGVDVVDGVLLWKAGRSRSSVWRSFSAFGILRQATGDWGPWTLPTANIVGADGEYS